MHSHTKFATPLHFGPSVSPSGQDSAHFFRHPLLAGSGRISFWVGSPILVHGQSYLNSSVGVPQIWSVMAAWDALATFLLGISPQVLVALLISLGVKSANDHAMSWSR